MLKAIGAAVVSYVAIFLIVFVSFSIVWMAMGTDGAFKTATWNVSTGWVVATLMVGIVAALVGGYLCSMIGKSRTAVMILLGIVVVLGLVDAVATATRPDAGLEVVRMGDASMFEAMGKARQPGWLPFVNLAIGVGGVLIGSRLHGGSSS
jgi:hypothetical protein